MTKTMFLGVERIDDPTEWSSWNINLRPSTALPAATRLSAARTGLGPVRIAHRGAPERDGGASRYCNEGVAAARAPPSLSLARVFVDQVQGGEAIALQAYQSLGVDAHRVCFRNHTSPLKQQLADILLLSGDGGFLRGNHFFNPGPNGPGG